MTRMVTRVMMIAVKRMLCLFCLCLWLARLSVDQHHDHHTHHRPHPNRNQVEELGDRQLVAATMQLIEGARMMARFIVMIAVGNIIHGDDSSRMMTRYVTMMI